MNNYLIAATIITIISMIMTIYFTFQTIKLNKETLKLKRSRSEVDISKYTYKPNKWFDKGYKTAKTSYNETILSKSHENTIIHLLYIYISRSAVVKTSSNQTAEYLKGYMSLIKEKETRHE